MAAAKFRGLPRAVSQGRVGVLMSLWAGVGFVAIFLAVVCWAEDPV